MFKYIALLALVACVAATGDMDAEVKVYENDVRADGFNYALETTNDIHQFASGDDLGNIQGFYEYVSPEGEHIQVNYIANENGYQPNSAILPTPPPVPEAIVRALEYLRTHAPKDEVHH